MRAQMIADGYIVEQPLITRRHNQYRKDVSLTEEQIQTLKDNYNIDARKLNEKNVLKVLRKRYKNYKFDNTILILT